MKFALFGLLVCFVVGGVLLLVVFVTLLVWLLVVGSGAGVCGCNDCSFVVFGGFVCLGC